jgi:hypothetical protein
MDDNWNKQIRVTIDDGKTFEGLPDGYTSEADNEPDGESIFIDNGIYTTELYTAEITNVEFI